LDNSNETVYIAFDSGRSSNSLLIGIFVAACQFQTHSNHVLAEFTEVHQQPTLIFQTHTITQHNYCSRAICGTKVYKSQLI